MFFSSIFTQRVFCVESFFVNQFRININISITSKCLRLFTSSSLFVNLLWYIVRFLAIILNYKNVKVAVSPHWNSKFNYDKQYCNDALDYLSLKKIKLFAWWQPQTLHIKSQSLEIICKCLINMWSIWSSDYKYFVLPGGR